MHNGSRKKEAHNWVTHSLILGSMLLVAAGIYFFWSPGMDLRDGRHDLKSNWLWMQHGWLGDDAWFERNHKDATRFRDGVVLKQLAEQLSANHIHDVFPHLCPSAKTGAIANSDALQVERFLDAFEGFRVLPWVGGVNRQDVLMSDEHWRHAFAKSCADLLKAHPRLPGIHINIEPVHSGNKDYLLLLEEMRQKLPAGKLISVAAYPPPTFWQQNADVHWDEAYSRQIAARVDQAVVMMYDTSLRSPGLYQQLMKDWTRDALAWYAPKEVLLGVPAYDDAGVGYHDPATENLVNAMLGIHAGLQGTVPVAYRGVSIYCEWTMTTEKWDLLRQRFCSVRTLPQAP